MQEWHGRLAPVLVLIFLMLSLTIYLVTPVLYLLTVRAPFIGAFVEHTLMINTSQPTLPGAWGDQFNLPSFGYQIVALNGEPVASSLEYRRALNQYRIGEQVAVTVKSPSGELVQLKIQLMRLPVLDQISYFAVPYLTGLVYLLCGLYVFAIRRHDPAGRAFTVFTSACAISLASLYDSYTTHYLVVLWTFSLAMIAGALINLALLFPERVRLVMEYPFLGWIGYGLAVVLGLAASTTIGDFEHPVAYVTAWRFEFIYISVALIVFLAQVGMRRFQAPSPIVREQARLIFWGAFFSFTPIGAWFLVTTLNPSVLFSSLYLLPLGIFPLATGYAIIRYRIASTDFLLSRAIVYTILTALIVAAYTLLLSGLSLIFGQALQPTSPVAVALMALILALSLNPLRSYLQVVVDRYFFKGQQVYRDQQQAFARDLTQVMELNEIIQLLRGYVQRSLSPAALHIYVFDPFSGHYVASPDERGKITSDVRFSTQGALVQVLSEQSGSLALADGQTLADSPASEQARLALLSANLFVPLPGRSQLIGWLALGALRSGEPYTHDDLSFLEALASRAALAIERAQVVVDLERRIRETNVLTRVAQGVSLTMVFDDILELIATQTNQVLPARDFRITLYDEETETLSHVFFLEDDERYNEKENLPIPVSQGLEWEVIRTQRPLMTDDYERECRRLGLLPAAHGIYAWMSVPLYAGAKTIGALSAGSRDPVVLYTEEQRNLLQAIADQASGAIVKARLLQEAERRARQLAMLNQIGIGLTSTLELKPLLNQILQSASEILNCEAGSLFLVDHDTDELVFEVVSGPVADSLLGKRLPPGAGLVGQAVSTGKAIIANDAKRRKEWFDKTDMQTGFDTQDLLVVPMRIADRTIGVIEVINKRNGAPFTQADMDLLMAFTTQATIAIENARLYTMTDQALAARVEELSVMQRIDRELNASLDIERAMRITLDWAMRQSAVEAGLVGAIDPRGVSVVVAQGYHQELPGTQTGAGDGHGSYLPQVLPGIRAAIESGQPQCSVNEAGSPENDFGLLDGAQLQIVIPIRRETETIGVMLLESTRLRHCPDETINFLMRLGDHAAIAIANARLYAEVNEANLAKSRFVSFVAHELKNPMSSIKGYTELMAGGMAGPINELQSNFLATVRSNVDRMNTIVSDLNDLTKIQVGNLRLEYRAISLQEIIDEVVRSQHRQIEEKKQLCRIQLPDDIPLVWADPARLTQILTNLISNAVKYTPPEGSITIGAQLSSPDQEHKSSGMQMVHLWVKDSGIGIPEEDQAKIFQSYFRTDIAKEMASGTGLGLTITKSLVEMQGGRIWFESAASQGSTFHITVPVAESQ